MKTWIPLLALPVLVSCASVRITPVQPYGPGSFTVSAVSHGPDLARAAAIDAANAECAGQGKTMTPQSENVGGRTTKTFVLVFGCQ